MAAPVSSFLSLDSSLRPILVSPSSSPSSSVSVHRSHSPSLSLSSARSTAGAIAASSSGSGVFLDDLGLYRLQTLDKYIRQVSLAGGRLEIRPMEDGEVDPTVQLLAESFVESMGMPPRYVPLLAYLVRQYVEGRRLLLPHAVMLVGFYREGQDEPKLACTAEVSFDTFGANAAPPTPLPPRNCPYICNMAVKKELRRYLILRCFFIHISFIFCFSCSGDCEYFLFVGGGLMSCRLGFYEREDKPLYIFTWRLPSALGMAD